MKAEIWRADLQAFGAEQFGADELARRHPLCACENACSPSASPGSIKPGEVVRLFLTSTSDIDGAKASKRKERAFRANSLQKVFTKGLSVVRLAHADRAELEYSASILHAFQFERSNEFGGVLAVVDFPVEAVRVCADQEARMCVLETPLEPNATGKFNRPSHADVAYSHSGISDEVKKAKRDIIYNQILEQGKRLNAEDVMGCNLVQFLPQVIKDAGVANS